jgi:hypothetical protein
MDGEEQMTDLDMLVCELEHENKLIRARNERLEAELVRMLSERALDALHDENERLGLYEPVAWMDVDGNVSDNNDHKCFPIPLYTTLQPSLRFIERQETYTIDPMGNKTARTLRVLQQRVRDEWYDVPLHKETI